MSSLHEQSDAVADRAMKEKLDSLLLEHRQALFSVLEMDRELQRNEETAASKAILVEAALTSAVRLLRAFLSSAFRKDREQRKETTANNEQQKNNEIIDLKKELEQCKETAGQQNNEIIDLKKELVQQKETAEQQNSEISDLKMDKENDEDEWWNT